MGRERARKGDCHPKRPREEKHHSHVCLCWLCPYSHGGQRGPSEGSVLGRRSGLGHAWHHFAPCKRPSHHAMGHCSWAPRGKEMRGSFNPQGSVPPAQTESRAMTQHFCHQSLTEITGETSRRTRILPRTATDRAQTGRVCAGTPWHPLGTRKWVTGPTHPHLSPSSVARLQVSGAQEEQAAGRAALRSKSFPSRLLGNGSCLPVPPVPLRHFTVQTREPHRSNTASFVPAKCWRSRCLPSTYRGERPAHPTPPLATKPPPPYNTDFQDRGRKRCFPLGVLQNSWEWMAGNLEGL